MGNPKEQRFFFLVVLDKGFVCCALKKHGYLRVCKVHRGKSRLLVWLILLMWNDRCMCVA